MVCKHIKKVIELKQRRLWKLKERQALEGKDTSKFLEHPTTTKNLS